MLQKKIVSRLVLTAALALMAGQAARADDWTGFYLGVAGGPQFDKSTWTATSVGPNNVFGVDGGSASAKMDGSHGRLGGFAGWSMAVTPDILAGVEADVYGVVDSTTTKTYLPGITYGGATPADSVSEAHKFDASFRGRLGALLGSDFLLYGTAGAAIRDLSLKGNCPGGATSWCGVSEQADISKTLVGFTAGVGLEGKLASQWTARVEYRYADYGHTNVTLFGSQNYGTDQTGNKIDLTSQIVTIGVVYHFGM